RSLYGLRQSPNYWWVTVDKYLGQIGLGALKSNPFVYIYISKHLDELTALETEKQEKVSATLTLYVDDLLIAGKDKKVLDMLERKLMAESKAADLGNVSLVLGMQVTRDRTLGHLTINQSAFTKGNTQRFVMDKCNPAITPRTGPEISIKQPVEKLLNEVDAKRYQSIVGSVMYLAQVTRYDNQYAMGGAKLFLRYSAESINHSIYCKKGKFHLTPFPDANWGNNPDNSKSTSSYIMLARAPVRFKVGLQGRTAQSTMEADLVAGALAIKEAVYCSNMIIEMECGSSVNTVPIYLDNTATLRVIASHIFSGRTKYIALRFFFMK
ncbi:unnamed protein product, partial [Sphacelaria rigidula]